MRQWFAKQTCFSQQHDALALQESTTSVAKVYTLDAALYSQELIHSSQKGFEKVVFQHMLHV